MSDAEFEARLKEIARLSKAQMEGPYTPQSDSYQALYLMETMALLLIEQHKAKQETPAS